MASNKKPRRKYQPKARNNLSYLRPLLGASCLSVDDQAKRAMQVHMAVERIAAAQGTRSDWGVVFDCINFVDALSKMPSVMTGAEDFVMTCMTTIERVMDRVRDAGRRDVPADEIAELRDLSSLWADLLARVTWREFIDAEAAVTVNVRRALAGCVAPGVRVVEPAAALEGRA